MLKQKPVTHKCVAVSENCKKCGMCLKPGCPAITKKEDGTIVIDDTLCNGCDLCMKMCKFDASKCTDL